MTNVPSRATRPVSASPKPVPSVSGARIVRDVSGGTVAWSRLSTLSWPSSSAPDCSVIVTLAISRLSTTSPNVANSAGPLGCVCARART